LVAGRALLYPPDGDVAAAVDTAAALVHGEARHEGTRALPGPSRGLPAPRGVGDEP
ncbi:deoxyribose-phosphate aldolase, partial [Streptomyces albidoflavus]